MLATLVQKPFDRAGWIFEIKWDGYRIMAEVDRGRVRLISRNGLSFTGRYPSVAAAMAKIPHQAVLDGEVVVLGANGYSDFEALQNYRSHRAPGHLVYQVFDILHLDGHDLCGLPLMRRKEILRQILPAVPELMFVDHIEEQGMAFFVEKKPKTKAPATLGEARTGVRGALHGMDRRSPAASHLLGNARRQACADGSP
jgi:bifunctional non-homologous end joining protein LigD